MPAGSLTEVVTFDHAMDTTLTTAAGFVLHGNDRGADYAPASLSWDPTGTALSINYTGLPDDFYTLTLFASGFQDTTALSPTGTSRSTSRCRWGVRNSPYR